MIKYNELETQRAKLEWLSEYLAFSIDQVKVGTQYHKQTAEQQEAVKAAFHKKLAEDDAIITNEVIQAAAEHFTGSPMAMMLSEYAAA